MQGLYRDQEPTVLTGLKVRTITRTNAVIIPGTMAIQEPWAANPLVAAQPTEDRASAKVAMREDVCRRRK